jgi:hypothetical protein
VLYDGWFSQNYEGLASNWRAAATFTGRVSGLKDDELLKNGTSR